VDQTNLEFDFDSSRRNEDLETPPRRSSPQEQTPTDSSKTSLPKKTMSKTTPSEPRSARSTTSAEAFDTSKNDAESPKTSFFSSSKGTNRATPNPIFTQYQQNVQRQSKEQKSVGTLLKIVGFVLIAGLLTVGGLAGYGGWILSRQIQEQSVSITELETKMAAEILSLRNNLRDANTILEDLNTSLQSQKLRATHLEKQLDAAQVSRKKERASDLQRVQKLENRVYDLERAEVRTR
jgi:hypothetical protein